MVTVLDVGLLNYFSTVFPAILVFAVVFAILTTTKILGENKTISAVVAIILALLVLIYPDITNLINYMAPWFVLVFIFAILLLLIYRIFGATEKDIATYLRTDRPLNWAILAVGIIILIAAVANVFGQRALSGAGQIPNETAAAEGVGTPSFESNIFNTLFHPKVLGLLLILAIAVFTIILLGGKTT